MNLNIFQETNPVGAGNTLVGAIYKNSAPSVLVASFPYPGPYTGQTQLHTFPGLLNVLYIYICYESPDGGPDGTIRNQFVVQPSNTAYQTRDDLYLIAGVSPNMAVGQPNYGPDPTLVGWNWGLERVAQGTQQYGPQYVKTVGGVDTTQDDLNADGFRLTASGDAFAGEEDFVIHFLPQLTTTTIPPATNIISDTVKVINNLPLGSDAIGKNYLVQGIPSYLQITLPALTSVGDNEPIYFNSCGGAHITCGIFANGADKINFFVNQTSFNSSTPATHIYLCQDETIAIYKWTDPATSTAMWQVLYMDSGYKKVGEGLNGYSKLELNTAILNGQLLSRTAYARLWEWVQTLEAGCLVSDTTWNGNTSNTLDVNGTTYYLSKGKFSTGDGSTTFRLPDLTLYGYVKLTNGLPGTFSVYTIATHTHTAHGIGSIPGSGGPYYFARNGANAAYSGGGTDKFGRSTTPDTLMRTGKDNDFGGLGTELETKPNSSFLYPLIRI